MTDFAVGPGVAQAIADNADEARSDERYIILDEGNKISLTFARDAQYYYYEADGTVRRLPFGEGSQEVAWDPWTNQPSQYYDWTCSACSTEWIERALGCDRGSDVYGNREATVYAIGYPNNINPTYGLMDGSGSQLRRVLRDSTGRDSNQGYVGFDAVYGLAASGTPSLMSGAAWYHWVAIRGVEGANLWIANSAPGYKGVWDVLSRADFDRLGGFSCVWLV
jgi:hypothetical protein